MSSYHSTSQSPDRSAETTRMPTCLLACAQLAFFIIIQSPALEVTFRAGLPTSIRSFKSIPLRYTPVQPESMVLHCDSLSNGSKLCQVETYSRVVAQDANDAQVQRCSLLSRVSAELFCRQCWCLSWLFPAVGFKTWASIFRTSRLKVQSEDARPWEKVY